MERKIGEIFEYNGEWYQCVRSILTCSACEIPRPCTKIRGLGYCSLNMRNDKEQVVFKKLEKVREPITVNGKNVQLLKTNIANCDNCAFYKDLNCDFTYHPRKCYGGEEGTYVEIKTKEDMEEKKTIFPKEDNALTRTVYAYVNGKISDKELIRSIKEMSDEYPYNNNNLKPFSLELAKQGKSVCTRDGGKARIICFDRRTDRPIVALIERDNHEEILQCCFDNGRCCCDITSDPDLMMLPEKKEGWVNVYKERIYSTKEEAIEATYDGVTYVDTVKIYWEE